jgi:hypothetical protein
MERSQLKVFQRESADYPLFQLELRRKLAVRTTRAIARLCAAKSSNLQTFSSPNLLELAWQTDFGHESSRL